MANAAARHVAVVNYPAHGHVNPTLPVMAELVRRGHRVSYVVAEQFADAVRATGAVPLPYESPMPKSWDTVAIPETITSDVVADAALAHAVEGFTPLPMAHAAFAADRPDVFLYDAFGYPTGRLLARKWGIPSVLLSSTFVANETFSPYAPLASSIPTPDPDHPSLVKARSTVVDALVEHGLADSPEQFAAGREDLTLVFLPRQFQPGAEHFDERFAFVGPCLGNRAGDWTPPDDRPVLLITMGSFGYHNQRAFFAQCLAAFAESPWRVVITIGRIVRPADLGPLPANVEIHPWVPQLAVLRHAKGFVSHAGMGSTMESLAMGVPPVVVPRTPEQQIVAGRLVELGLGRRLDPVDLGADSLCTTVNELTEDTGTAARVGRMRADIDDAGGPVRAADEIERLATT
jgi:MGT family glycosyltransferase